MGGTWLMATNGEDSLREERAPRGRVSEFQEGLMEKRAPRSSGDKQREVALRILGRR